MDATRGVPQHYKEQQGESMSYLDSSKIRVIAQGLGYPEGPVWCSDGSVLLVEIKAQCLSRVRDDGSREVVAAISGGPNGAAIGPDGAVYVCNDGGFDWQQVPPPPAPAALWISTTQPKNYTGGKLQKVDLKRGAVSDLFTETATPPAYPPYPFLPKSWSPPFPLRGPDDLVFDRSGGCWFTDWGKLRPFDRDVTGVYYMSPDGSTLRQAIFPLNAPNGIALSPDGLWLYVALSYERRVLKYQVGPGGTFKPNPKTLDGSYLVTGAFRGSSVLDSMAVDEQGNLYVATMIPMGADPTVNGGITVVSPDGEILDWVEIRLPDGTPVPLPSNICFGGAEMKTAYITCGGSGHLISMPAQIPGLRLNFNC
jgi:gluconolactonase